MSDSPHGSGSGTERPRPSFGIPADSSASSANQAPGSAYGSAPEYGQSSASDPAAGYGTSAPAYATQEPTASAEQPFGGYGSGAGGAAVASGPPKKQKPVGIILTVLGVLGLILGIILVVVGLVRGFGSLADQAGGLDSPVTSNSSFEGSTSAQSLAIDDWELVMVYVPAADSAATCSAAYSDGSALEAGDSNASSNPTVNVDGQPYILYSSGFVAERADTITVTCENVSAPLAVVGPISVPGVLGWLVALPIVGSIIAIGGFFLALAGVIVMIVRASRRRRAVQS